VKITRIETFVKNPVGVVRVTDADGAVGIGQMAPYHADIAAMVLHRQVAPLALGRSADEIAGLVADILRREYKFAGSYLCRAVAGLDTALWDLRGRRAGVPVVRLVGGEPRAVPVYGSSMRRDNDPAAEAERLLALRAAAGYGAFKIRVGDALGDDRDAWPGRTESIIPAVRRALGDDVALYADANGGFSPERAIAVGHLLEAHGYVHYEEPCPYPELEWTKRVADALTIPVAGGEQDFSMATWRRMVRLRAVDIVQPDVGYVGGFARALAVARLGAEAGLTCTPHAANRSLITVFTLHLVAAIPNAGPFMEYSIEPTPWTEDLFDPAALAVRDGRVAVPTGPGWGVPVSDGWLRAADHQESR
jgi:L-alanine-DL-glutamate epimerase-like enolase superfamily enzyme